VFTVTFSDILVVFQWHDSRVAVCSLWHSVIFWLYFSDMTAMLLYVHCSIQAKRCMTRLNEYGQACDGSLVEVEAAWYSTYLQQTSRCCC